MVGDRVTRWFTRSPRRTFPERNPVPRAAALGRAEFARRHLHASKPVVLEGALDTWPALRTWSPEYFIEKYGDRPVDAFRLGDSTLYIDPRVGFVCERMSLATFLRSLTEPGPPRYRLRCEVGHVLPEVMHDVEIPAYCARGLRLEVTAWMSGRGTYTPLHLDLPHNLLCQVTGRKRLILFAPIDTLNVYAPSPFSSAPQFSQVDLARPDLDKFPRLRRAVAYECVLGPGDMLFVPSRWWHFAESLDITFSVSFWWATPALYPALALIDWMKRLRGLTR